MIDCFDHKYVAGLMKTTIHAVTPAVAAAVVVVVVVDVGDVVPFEHVEHRQNGVNSVRKLGTDFALDPAETLSS